MIFINVFSFFFSFFCYCLFDASFWCVFSATFSFYIVQTNKTKTHFRFLIHKCESYLCIHISLVYVKWSENKKKYKHENFVCALNTLKSVEKNKHHVFDSSVLLVNYFHFCDMNVSSQAIRLIVYAFHTNHS